MQREPGFSPLGHPLGRRECSQVVRDLHSEALIVFLKFILKLGKTTSFSRNFGKNFCQNQYVVPKELPSFRAASCRWLESVC